MQNTSPVWTTIFCQFVSILFRFLKHYLLGLDQFYFRSVVISLQFPFYFQNYKQYLYLVLKHCLELSKISDLPVNEQTGIAVRQKCQELRIWFRL